MNRELLSKAFGDIDEQYIVEAYSPVPADAPGSPERTVCMKKKRVITFVLAAALILALGISAYAIWGVPRSTGTHLMPKAAEYTSLSDLPKIEKDIGYKVTVPERFSNGYDFAGLHVEGEAVFGENNEVLEEYYAVHVIYSDADASELTLHLSPMLDIESQSAPPAPNEQRTVNGAVVNLNLDHYRVVPEDYEKTEEDLARESAGHYYISFGSDEIEEYDMAFADFRLNGVTYTLMDMAADQDSFDTLFQMAREIIEEANG